MVEQNNNNAIWRRLAQKSRTNRHADKNTSAMILIGEKEQARWMVDYANRACQQVDLPSPFRPGDAVLGMPDGETDGATDSNSFLCIGQPDRTFRPKRFLIACLSPSSARWVAGVQVLDVKVGKDSLLLLNNPIDAECFTPTYREEEDALVFDVTAQKMQILSCFFRSKMPVVIHSAFIGDVVSASTSLN